MGKYYTERYGDTFISFRDEEKDDGGISFDRALKLPLAAVEAFGRELKMLRPTPSPKTIVRIGMPYGAWQNLYKAAQKGQGNKSHSRERRGAEHKAIWNTRRGLVPDEKTARGRKPSKPISQSEIADEWSRWLRDNHEINLAKETIVRRAQD